MTPENSQSAFRERQSLDPQIRALDAGDLDTSVDYFGFADPDAPDVLTPQTPPQTVVEACQRREDRIKEHGVAYDFIVRRAT